MTTIRARKVTIFVCIACLLCGLLAFVACDGMDLSTTNERLDSTEKQLTYQTSSMTMCTIEKAYENDWLTQTDLAYAMYYARGKVYTCKESDWKKYLGAGKEIDEVRKEIDFVLTEECPAINEQVERDIKRYEYEKLNKNDLTFEEFEQNYSFRFVGSYNGTFIITDIKTIYWNYPTDVPPPIWIAGFVWYGSYDHDLFVVRYV